MRDIVPNLTTLAQYLKAQKEMTKELNKMDKELLDTKPIHNVKKN